MEGPTCTGCNNIIDEGSVIAFGDSLFHLKCFVCAKCSEPVDCDSNLLLLSNGRPVCESCSYCCNACKQVIRDEAIMTGDEAYHSDCFRCVSCKKRIDDLVFTQTSKGIHCTPCHKKRKAEKQKRREERQKRPELKESSQSSSRKKKIFDEKLVNAYINEQQTSYNTEPLTPSRSRSNSVDCISPKIRLLADITPSRSEVLSSTKAPTTGSSSPPLSIGPKSTFHPSQSTASLSQSVSTTTVDDMNLSFFENDSTDLFNLTKKLGASISIDLYAEKAANLTRASQLLEHCLIMDEEHGDEQLRTDLEIAQAKLVAMEASYNKIKNASRKAIEELNRAKDEFTKEVALRQQQEYMLTQLRHQLRTLYLAKSHTRTEAIALTKEEIAKVAQVRAELDKTCHELKGYRRALCEDIGSLTQGLEETYTTEIKSLKLDRDQLRQENKALESARDEILHEMVMLNTKNAELTEMNNDLSRRMTEREREAAAVMAGTSFLSPSPSLSSELDQPSNKMFRLKKKGNMFSKFNGGKSKDPSLTMYGHTSTSTLSLNSKQSSESTHHGAHTFLPTSFLRPTRCDACEEKMWGLSELRCQGCMYAAHARCLPHVPHSCYTSSQTRASVEQPSIENNTLLGGDLIERAKFEERSIPLIIERCIGAVEKRGMDYEGIYRKSGGAAQIRLILQSFMNGDPVDLDDDESINDICAVTSVLKQYFRELTNPLLTFSLYSQFIGAVSNQTSQNSRKEKFSELLSHLPKAHYETLQYLIKHLYSVQQRHDKNLMTTKNLAMVFGPTILRDIESSRDLVDMSYKNAVVEYLILNANQLF